MSYKIVEWNINNAAHAMKIPRFVGKEIINLHSDLIILTEFVYCSESKNFESKNFLKDVFTQNGYDYCVTHNFDGLNKQNDVVIAWDKEKFSSLKQYSLQTTDSSKNPNLLVVQLHAKEENKDFILAGCRITMGSENLRLSQMTIVLETLSKISTQLPVVIAGDFNNFRRGYSSKIWSLEALKNIAAKYKYVKYTPTGSSIYQENPFSKDYEFPEDHFFTKFCQISDYKYDRLFTSNNPTTYLHGTDFQVYDCCLHRNTWQIICGSGIPDHAMLIGVLDLQENVM